MAKARSTGKGGTAKAKQAAAVDAAGAAYETLDVGVRNAVAIVVLNRPAVHNAFNETLIAELTAVLRALDGDSAVRAVVLAGAGESFCAGADLNWMKKMAGFSRAQNLADAHALAAMLATLDTLTKPTIARVHGAIFGGGVGLVACCDIAIGTQDAVFAFSEARLGLIPATISPYVIEAIGVRAARRYFLTAERFSAAEAHRIGLVHEIAPATQLDATVEAIVAALLEGGSHAQARSKRLISEVADRPIEQPVIDLTARAIAEARASEEAREGLAAFFEKRKPKWRT